MVEELLQMLESEEPAETSVANLTEDSESDTEELHAISDHALKGLEGNHTLRLKGKIQRFEVIILVDSGSSTSFISSNLAEQLKGAEPLKKVMKVKVANGEILQGDSWFPNCQWKCQGATFGTDFKVLPLDCYDAVIGMDWLQAHSPMQVDWIKKWMIIPAGKQQHKLQGITANTSECEEIS